MVRKNVSSDVRDFGDTAKALARNPLGIIALFIVLVYGFACLLTAFSNSLAPTEKAPLVYFLVVFPVLVLGVFTWLVIRHTGKLFAPGDYRDEANYVAIASLAVASSKVKVVPQSHRSGRLWRWSSMSVPRKQAHLAIGVTGCFGLMIDRKITFMNGRPSKLWA